MLGAEAVVDAFIAAVEAKDLDAAMAFIADDISYENMPMKPIVGRSAVRAALEGFLGPAGQVEWVINRQVAIGNVVANERVDRFQVGDGWLELPVAGFFEVNAEGLVTLWRDYFDLGSYRNQMKALTAS